MKARLIALANKAHLSPNVWVRRPLLVLAMIGLALWTLAFWLIGLPVCMVLFPGVAILKGLAAALRELPGLTIAQAKSDAREWRINLAGARRVWREQKTETAVARPITRIPG